MPSGKNHDRITWFCLPGIAIAAMCLTGKWQLSGLSAIAFLFSGLMFGPDLDIHSVQYRRWGKLRYLWLPYRSWFPHRSVFSHGFLIGTLIRLLYLFAPLLLLCVLLVAIAQFAWGFYWNWQEFMATCLRRLKTDYWQEAIALWVGLESGAMSHSLADWLASWWQKSYPPQRKRRDRGRIRQARGRGQKLR